MKCAYCKNFDIEAHPGHRKVGYGLCNGYPKLRAHFVSIRFDSDRKKFKQASESEIDKRREIWKRK